LRELLRGAAPPGTPDAATAAAAAPPGAPDAAIS
jgi:hypothetical protein